MNSARHLDSARGALIGSALGDTVGLYTEFLSPGQADGFAQQAWTDDTDHTILIVLSFLRNGKLLPDDFAKRLRTWCEQGLRCLDRLPMGLGNTVGRVVLDKNFLSDPTGTASACWEKSGRNLASNGSVMRTTPIGIICMNMSEEETFHAAICMGAVTHADPRCALSVATVSALVRGLCRAEIATEADIDALLERAWVFTTATLPEHPLEREEFDRHVHAQSLNELVLCCREMGYVYKTLGSALWCLRETLNGRETFKSAISKLVMCGGDADTNAAVAGGLMGAYCGYDELPAEWRDGLRHKEWYLDKIAATCIVTGLTDGTYDADDDHDTDIEAERGFWTKPSCKGEKWW